MSTEVRHVISIIDKVTAPYKRISESVRGVTSQVKQNTQAITDISNKISMAAQKRRQLMNMEKQDLIELKIRRKMAFSVEEIDAYDARIAETTKRINTLAGTARRSSGILGMLKSQVGMFAMGAFTLYQGFNFAKGSVEAYDQEKQAEAQVKSGLESTNNISGRTFEQIKAQASQLQGVTLFSDEEILKAQSVLLTFTNIRNEIFDKATPAIVDMAQKLGMDLQSATLQVGKALKDPIRGLMMLGRAGVQFSEEQKRSIEMLVEQGRLQEAQMIIINELQTQFGGAAVAAAQTGLGPWKQLSNLWGDARETLGGLILGVINKLLPMFKSIVAGLQNTFNWIKRNSDSIVLVAKVVGVAVGAWGLYKLAVLGVAKSKIFMSAITATYSAITGIATGKVIGLTGAMKALSLATRLNPIGLIITVVAAATAGIALLISRMSRLTQGHKDFISVQSQAQRKFLEEKYQVENLARVINDSNRPYEERQRNLQKLKELSNEHFGALKLEEDGVKGLDLALQNYLKTRQKEIFQEATKEKQEEYIKKLFDYQAGLLENEYAVTKWEKGLMLVTNSAYAVDQYAESKKRKFFNDQMQSYSDFMSRIKDMSKQFGFDMFGFEPGEGPEIDADFHQNENSIRGGDGIKNITINIDRLNGAEILQMQGYSQNESEDFGEKLKLQLLTVVNDVN